MTKARPREFSLLSSDQFPEVLMEPMAKARAGAQKRRDLLAETAGILRNRLKCQG